MNNDDSLPLLHGSSITLTYYVDIPARIPSSDESFNVAEELNQEAPLSSFASILTVLNPDSFREDFVEKLSNLFNPLIQ
jgi:hypothetical protein